MFRWILDRSILEFHFKIDRLIYIIAYMFLSLYEKIENTKELIRSVYRSIDNTEAKTKRTIEQIIIYKILHKKLRSEPEERH